MRVSCVRIIMRFSSCGDFSGTGAGQCVSRQMFLFIETFVLTTSGKSFNLRVNL